MNPQLLPIVKSELIMTEIRGAGVMGEHFPYTTRLSSFFPGHKCSFPTTVVSVHLPVGPSGSKGVSAKATNLAVAACCANCHDNFDGRDLQRYNFIAEKYPGPFIERMLCNLVETDAILLQHNILMVTDGELVA